MSSKAVLERLRERVAGEPFATALAAVVGEVAPAVLTTSFSLEDQILLHLIAERRLPVRVATLDTGRLFAETYATWTATRERYPVTIETFAPERAALEALVTDQGPNGFYASVANRQACCHVRKVVPLTRALAGARLWITGIRRDQSPAREGLSSLEWDEARGLVKYHPLFDLTWDEARAYAAAHAIPVNPLHDRGFPSIGCAPCTRAIAPGESFRAGRWWWESDEKKECGLHLKNGRLIRKGNEA
jgi:phosphoadenosine phosphosulfate reductase